MTKIDQALDWYNKGNPISRWIKNRTPEGYINRWVFIPGLLFLLLMASSYLNTYSEPYIECTKPWGCLHPFTGEFVPYGYTEGPPISTQISGLFGYLSFFFLMILIINHSVWGIKKLRERRKALEVPR
jgi:hypothetical protein